MGETRAAKQARLAAQADKMRAAQAAVGQIPKDAHEAFRRGYNEGVRVAAEDPQIGGPVIKPPFSSPELRKAWRDGFAFGRKGIAVTLPPGSVMPPRPRGGRRDE